jgi:drug/metabolite transporter (DMT)-like permease
MSLAEPLRRWQELPGTVRGAVYLLINALLLTALSYLIRVAGQTLPTFEIFFFRNLFMVSVLIPLALRPGRPNAFRTRHVGLHMTRGVLSFLSMIAFYWSFMNLPFAESTALMYTMPLFIIVLSVLFLGERVGWRRSLATICGFAGVVLMLAPGMTAFSIALLAPLSIGLGDGVITLVIKRLTRTESVLSILTYMCCVAFVLSGLSILLVTFALESSALQRLAAWKTPDLRELAILALLTASSGVAQMFNIMGWRAGETTALAPVTYTQIVFAGIVGFAAFGEIPPLTAGLGAVIIVGSTLYIARREAQLAKRGRT